MSNYKSLALKLAKVMAEVKYIQKRGENKFHGYKYATEADVNEKIREEFAKLSVALIPSVKSHSVREITTKKGNIEYITTIDMEFTLVDAESGETMVFSMSGSGQDPGDKGIFKAISGCQKYALMKLFMIPTGDDPEADHEVDERMHDVKPANKSTGNHSQTDTPEFVPMSEPQYKKLCALVADMTKFFDKGVVKDKIKIEVGEFNEIKDLDKTKASKAIKFLDDWKAQQKAGA